MICSRTAHRIIASFGLLISAVLLTVSLTMSFFSHTHHLADGRIFVHSHCIPSEDSGEDVPVKRHNHTTEELSALYLLWIDSAVEQQDADLSIDAPQVSFLPGISNDNPKVRFFSTASLRGPPKVTA